VSLPDPVLLPPLLAHLSTYGECNRLELAPSSRGWLGLLTEAGWLVALDAETYAVSPAFLALPQTTAEMERLWRVCFAVPQYRRYLSAILAEGLVTAAQVSALRDHVEKWIFQDLVCLAPEINAILDEVEAGQARLVEKTKDSVSGEFARCHRKDESFAAWDAALFGFTGTSDQLFTAILSRATGFKKARPVWPADEKPLALLVDFDLPEDDSGQLVLPPPAPWTRARRAVHSSLPFYDYAGAACFDRTRAVLEVWQDVLVGQPYYRAALRCAIVAHFSGYGFSEVFLTAPGPLEETRVKGERNPGVVLADLLPELVTAMGYWPGARPSAEQTGRILQHWIALNVIERREGYLQLAPSYVQKLHEPQGAHMLLRGPAKPERENFEKRLRESL